MRYFIKLDTVQKPEDKETSKKHKKMLKRCFDSRIETRQGQDARWEALDRVRKLNRAK